MSATLYLAPTTDAVLAHIVELVRARRQEQPLAPLTCLLPSGDAVRQLRRGLGSAIAVRPLQFYSLSAAILAESGSRTREMNDLATRRLTRGILTRMNDRGELTSFAPMLDKPGFIEVLVEWLREMKTQGITPEQVAAHATDGERDRQLARFYARYQATLREGDCADADGLLWLAAEAVERDQALLGGAGELIVSGFDQFSPVQLRIVAALAERLPVTVYLLWDARRGEESLALSRLAPTRRALVDALRPQEVILPALDACGPALGHVRQAIFEANALRVIDDGKCIAAVAAPSPEAEARHALRRIKRLLLDGVREEQIAMLAPHPTAYRAIVSAVSREYGVPVAVETTLGENPCVAAVLNLLGLAPEFRRRQTFDALRSPYIKQSWLDAEQVALLDALTRERPVIAGRDQWEYALTPPPVTDGGENADDEDRGEPPLLSQLAPETVGALRSGLAAFFDHVTPPADTSPPRCVLWIQDALLGLEREREDDDEAGEETAPSLRMVEAAEEGEWQERDLRALAALLRALREWLDAHALVTELRLDPDVRIEPAERRRELLEWLPSVPVPPDPRRAAVRFGPLETIRAVAVEHLFALGLGEGEFPRPPRPDPFYTSAERARHPLPLARPNSGEDASLWWQVLCNCQCSLTVLRSRLDPSGAAWLPSAYWEAVVGLVDGLAVEEPKLSPRPAVEDAACAGELLEALAGRAAPDCAGVPEELAAPWRAVNAARAVAETRAGWLAPAEHEGALADPALLQDVARRYGPQRSWSVSRLNRFGACPYAFWAQYALELEAIADPEEGMNALQRGSLVHRILEVLFARLTVDGIAPGEDTTDPIIERLDGVCDDVLPRAAERYGFRPGPLWEREQAELRGELRAYLAWECRDAQASGFRPYRQELKFGLPGADLRAVEVAGLDGATIRLHGVIDRIDRDATGRLRVIDYKTGSTRLTPKDIAAGRALQSALYAWAAGRLIPESAGVALSAYRHTGSREQSGVIECGSGEGNALMGQAAASAVRFALAARDGWFAAQPSRGSAGKVCGERCDFLGLCRVTRHGARKAQRHGPAVVGQSADAASAAPGGEA